ncbi:ABC transporter ATP-binding protein [Bordetella bronchialis]|uniref:ABC transporter ATP-binding protein n=1 Tax=Bordetella bronchialis TaxID=463025 RepID=UPI0009F3E316|nr:ABC transporter ATP-binding protein [Bordetella bronchialis]
MHTLADDGRTAPAAPADTPAGAALHDASARATPLLSVRGLDAGYGKIGILHGIDLDVNAGEIVAILGPNGAGKSTLMRAISGLLPLTAGSVSFNGADLSRATPRDAARAGLVHVIEGHRVFTQQSVIDNMMLAGYDAPRAERRTRVEEALAFFPEIAAKRHDRAGALSGGQQQMLVVAQGLVKRPRLLILDEPSAGLSPVLVDRVLTVAGQLRQQGTAIVLVEQLVEKALALADRVYAVAQGRIAMQAGTREPDLAARLERAYFGDHGRVAAQ